MRLSALLLVAISAIAAEIPQGAHVLLRMENNPISVAGNIILPVVSYIQAVVTNAKRSGRVKDRATSSRLASALRRPGKEPSGPWSAAFWPPVSTPIS